MINVKIVCQLHVHKLLSANGILISSTSKFAVKYLSFIETIRCIFLVSAECIIVIWRDNGHNGMTKMIHLADPKFIGTEA